jgi:rubrerythrin
MELKDSKTYSNLMTAFSGESQAKNKYTFYSKAAKKEGYEQIAQVFSNTAKNEEAHARIWFDYITGGVGSTQENLTDAAAGEHYEWSEMYADFAKVAREEGFDQIAMQFDNVAAIEKMHEQRYLDLAQNVREGEVFSRNTQKSWICRNCGYVHEGTSAPTVCPVCKHPQAYFEIKTGC